MGARIVLAWLLVIRDARGLGETDGARRTAERVVDRAAEPVDRTALGAAARRAAGADRA
jgi:hypothetical protein